ncbi:hypothetical protein QYF36_006986 [Acer negundo]|nr:hypothetical protein QYF36_006986 [Acer negundo]
MDTNGRETQKETTVGGGGLGAAATEEVFLAALQENRKRQAPCCGAFLLKDEPGSDTSATEIEKSVRDIHEVGILDQITSIQGDKVILIGHRPLRITKMVSEDPLMVKVDHLKDNLYDKDHDVIKATSFEVISTLTDVLKTSSLWRDHVQTYTQHIGDFSFPSLADFGAAISGGNKVQCQAVLQELNESIAKAIEEKISGEQHRYLLNDRLKAIKKPCWMAVYMVFIVMGSYSEYQPSG